VEGCESRPDDFILCRHIYIDESAQKAQEVAEPAMRYFFTVFNRGFNEAVNKGAVDQRVLAALTTERSFNYFREGNRERRDFSKLDWEGLIGTGYLIAGNPDSVAGQIQDQMKQIGADHFMGMFHIGNLHHDKVISSLNLFRKEIMPRLH
jgi:alkanesulfonate monooxygenase SsuD/methylene tetrahydromethanopterin reductase-like flavin-dependent oxidoreductase (luciferase family)